MDYSGEMLRYLEDADVAGMRVLWSKVGSGYPQHDAAGTLIAIHMARTACEALRFNYRGYSHKWLVERGLPSQLPDVLKPKAERLYPVTKPCVGIAVGSKWPEVKREITKAMSDAVEQAAADGRLTDDEYVRGRMTAARVIAKRKLFG